MRNIALWKIGFEKTDVGKIFGRADLGSIVSVAVAVAVDVAVAVAVSVAVTPTSFSTLSFKPLNFFDFRR